MAEVEFIEKSELEKRFFDFKKRWYDAVKSIEKLNNFKSGFDDAFISEINKIYESVDKCKKDADFFRDQLKHYFPSSRDEIDWLTQKVSRALGEIREMIKRDKELLTGSRDIGDKIKELNKKLADAEEKLREAERESREVCGKYFDLKSEYTRRRDKIEETINKELSKIKEKFISMTSPIAEGRELFLGKREVALDELFDILFEAPEDIEKVVLFVARGGILGKKFEEDQAKTSVFRYVSKEILENAEPIRKEKEQLISKLESEFKEMHELEKECEEKEKTRKKAEKPVEELKNEIVKIKKSEAFKFAEYDGILEVREEYLAKIRESEKAIKEYLDFALVSFKKYVELEEDPEKRELLGEIREAKLKAESMEKEAKKAREELNAKIKELTMLKAAKENVEAQLKETKEKLFSTAKELEAAKAKMQAVDKKLKDFEEIIAKKVNEIVTIIEKKGGEEKKVEEKMKDLRTKA